MSKVIDAVFHVVCHVTDLLHPAPEPAIVVVQGRTKVAKKGLHGGELIVDVLDVTADTTDQSVLLGKETAQLS